MWKGFGFGLLCLALVQAAVIRPEVPEETTTANPPPSDEESTTLAGSTLSPALSRDEEASILIDPAPGTLQEDEAPAPALALAQEKSGKLLLLTTPPKRPVEIERQLEEDGEDEAQETRADGDATATTTVPPKAQKAEDKEEAETSSTTESSSSSSSSTTTPATTKLFAIDARPVTEDSPPPTVAVSLSQDNVTVSIAEQPQVPGDNNAAVELAIVEPEAEYVLVDGSHGALDADLDLDSDLQLASFTHIDSDVHLQPVVHSVEIVPTSLDDPLIVNYVHNLR
ncbi:hypothetical protein KR018_007612 [Drosophila ironensis]|nr:hypothetical protein KR018_007612 [Drosophila ironensis]